MNGIDSLIIAAHVWVHVYFMLSLWDSIGLYIVGYDEWFASWKQLQILTKLG